MHATPLPEDYRSGFIALIGRPNVGKSTLVNQLVGEKVAITSPVAQTTRNRLRAILTTEVAEMVFQQHREAGVLRTDQTFQVTPTQAELVKYTKNTFYALKVTFANQMYDICQGMNEDWYAIRDIITADQAQPIGPSHLDPIFGLRRGFGGKCLPKDSSALGVLAEELGVKYAIMDAMQADNDALRSMLTGKPSDVVTNDD